MWVWIIAGIVAAAALVARATLERVRIFEFERAVRFLDGRLRGTLTPGRHWIRRGRTTLVRIDVRPRFVTVPSQELLTADGVTLKTTVAVRYVVADPTAAVTSTQDYAGELYLLVQLALRGIVGAVPVEELLEQRQRIGEQLLQACGAPAEAIGLGVLEAGVKDVMFPGDLKRIFASVAQARVEGRAALERARGESAALRNLANAARLLEDNPALAHLRLLQVAGESTGSTFVIGVPPALGAPSTA